MVPLWSAWKGAPRVFARHHRRPDRANVLVCFDCDLLALVPVLLVPNASALLDLVEAVRCLPVARFHLFFACRKHCLDVPRADSMVDYSNQIAHGPDHRRQHGRDRFLAGSSPHLPSDGVMDHPGLAHAHHEEVDPFHDRSRQSGCVVGVESVQVFYSDHFP